MRGTLHPVQRRETEEHNPQARSSGCSPGTKVSSSTRVAASWFDHEPLRAPNSRPVARRGPMNTPAPARRRAWSSRILDLVDANMFVLLVLLGGAFLEVAFLRLEIG